MQKTTRASIGLLGGLVLAGAATMMGANGSPVAGHSGSGDRSIIGRVESPLRRPVPGVCVTAYIADGPDGTDDRVAFEARALTSSDGTFALRRLLEGDYKIRFGGSCNTFGRITTTSWYRNERSFDRAAVVHVRTEDVTGVVQSTLL